MNQPLWADTMKRKRTATVFLIVCFVAIHGSISIARADDAQQTITAKRAQWKAAEKKSMELARSIRQSQAPTETDKSTLKTAVEESFRLQQELHKLEVDQLETRAAQLSKAIDQRQLHANEIISRRVNDLMDLNLDWDFEPKETPLAETNLPPKSNSNGVLDQTPTHTIVAGFNLKNLNETPQQRAQRTAALDPARVNAYLNALNSMGLDESVEIALADDGYSMSGGGSDAKGVMTALGNDRGIWLVEEPPRIPEYANEYLRLVRQGRIRDAAKLTGKTSTSRPSELASCPDLEKIQFTEILVSYKSARLFSQSFLSDDGWEIRYSLEMSHRKVDSGHAWECGRFMSTRQRDVDKIFSDTLEDRPESQVFAINSEGKFDTRSVKLNFQQSEWSDVVNWVEENLKVKASIQEVGKLTGTFSYIDDEVMSPQKAYRVLQSVLRQRNSDLTIKKLPPVNLHAVVHNIANGRLRFDPDKPVKRIEITIGSSDNLSIHDNFAVLANGIFHGFYAVSSTRFDKALIQYVVHLPSDYELKVGDRIQLMYVNRSAESEQVQSSFELVNQLGAAIRDNDEETVSQLCSATPQQISAVSEFLRQKNPRVGFTFAATKDDSIVVCLRSLFKAPFQSAALTVKNNKVTDIQISTNPVDLVNRFLDAQSRLYEFYPGTDDTMDMMDMGFE